MGDFLRKYVAGLVGAAALTGVHQAARRRVPGAPRMDVVGMRAMAQAFRGAGLKPPDKLYRFTMAGDLASNATYYSLVAIGPAEGAWRRGVMLGLAAGFAALALPKPAGLGPVPNSDQPVNWLMTLGWYVAGGLAAAAATQLLAPKPRPATELKPRPHVSERARDEQATGVIA